MRAALASLLVALPAVAEVPGGHAYLGMGGSWMVPLPSSDGRRFWGPLHQEVALSLELAYETRHALVAVALEYGGPTAFQPEFGLASLRAGWIFGEGPTAPYFSAGIGLMRETIQLRYDCVGGGCLVAVAEGTGGALTMEAGVLFFRDLRVGRMALAARFVEPFFEIRPQSGPSYVYLSGSDRLPLLLFTLRLYG